AAGWFLGRASRQIFYIATILGIIYLLDFYVPKPLPVADESHSGKTVVITGANSGVGFETARQLAVTYGANVVLGCRSKPKCDAAEKTINEEVALSKKDGKATALFIDLDSFESVNSFVKRLQGMDIDVLFNNAEELIKTHPSLRVVTTSSIGQQFCAMSFHVPKFVLSASQLIPLPKFITSTFYLDHSPGCINASYLKNNITTPTNDLAYMHAKMANLMHAIEIPVHHPQATSVAIDLGFVSTGNHKSNGFGMDAACLIRGSPNDSCNTISTNEELLQGDFKDERLWQEGGIVIDTLGSTKEAFSYPWWDNSMNLGRSRMLTLSRELWEVSDRLIHKYAREEMAEE
ncbi:hypothetical protein ACHAXN_007725, partial [Cyclotella atomus]